MPGKDATPTLDAGVVEDDDAVLGVVERLALNAPSLRRLSRTIQRRQTALRRVAGDAAWAAYLCVEEATNARQADLLLLAVRWAYREGARARSRRGAGR